MKEPKIVTREGLQFKVMSSRERDTELGGRFFSCIGRDADGWTLFEHDQDITVHGSAKPLGRKFERLLDTKALVAEIRRLVETGERLPTDIRPPWEIDEARHNANQAALVERRAAQQQAAKPARAVICSACFMAYNLTPAKTCPLCGKPKGSDRSFKLESA